MGDEFSLLPRTKPDDDEDVVWGLQTAGALWARGEQRESLVWIRRAAEAAGAAGHDMRAVELAKHAVELEEYVGTVEQSRRPPPVEETPPIVPVRGGTLPPTSTAEPSSVQIPPAPSVPSVPSSPAASSGPPPTLASATGPLHAKPALAPISFDEEPTGDYDGEIEAGDMVTQVRPSPFIPDADPAAIPVPPPVSNNPFLATTPSAGIPASRFPPLSRVPTPTPPPGEIHLEPAPSAPKPSRTPPPAPPARREPTEEESKTSERKPTLPGNVDGSPSGRPSGRKHTLPIEAPPVSRAEVRESRRDTPPVSLKVAPLERSTSTPVDGTAEASPPPSAVTPSPTHAGEVSIRLGMTKTLTRKAPRAPILDPWSDDAQIEDAQTARPVSKPGQYSYDPNEDDVITSAAPLEAMLAPKKKPPPPPVRARTLTPSNQPEGIAQIQAAIAAHASSEELTPTPGGVSSAPPQSVAPFSAVPPAPQSTTSHPAKPPPPRRTDSHASMEIPRQAPIDVVPVEPEPPTKRESVLPAARKETPPAVAKSVPSPQNPRKSEPPPPRAKSEPPPPRAKSEPPPPRAKSEPPPPRAKSEPPPRAKSEPPPPRAKSEPPRHPSQFPAAPRAQTIPLSPAVPALPADEKPRSTASLGGSDTKLPTVPPRSPTLPPPGLAPSVPPLYDRIEVFSDLPREVQRVLNQRGALITLAIEEEHQGFALAMVMAGQAAICATIVDAPASRLSEGGLACTFGVSELSVAVRAVALAEDTRLAVWSRSALEEILADCPWVLGDLALVGDKLMSLAGATMGPLGDLDEASREMTLSRLDIRHVEPGHLLVEKGADNLGLQIVGLGTLELCEDGEVVSALSSGDLVFPDLVLEGGAAPQAVRAGPQGATVLTAPRMVAVELFSMLPMLLELLRVA